MCCCVCAIVYWCVCDSVSLHVCGHHPTYNGTVTHLLQCTFTYVHSCTCTNAIAHCYAMTQDQRNALEHMQVHNGALMHTDTHTNAQSVTHTPMNNCKYVHNTQTHTEPHMHTVTHPDSQLCTHICTIAHAHKVAPPEYTTAHTHADAQLHMQKHTMVYVQTLCAHTPRHTNTHRINYHTATHTYIQ